MNPPNHERPPLKSIETSGTYQLRLVKPKLEKVRQYEDGTTSARLFFVDENGNCLSKSYGTKYGKALAMLVGKVSGKYTKEIRLDATPAEFIEYVSPACGIQCPMAVEVTPNGEWQGKPQFKYKLNFPRGSEKPVVANDLPPPEGVPF
jgi:hypothetical protein